MKLLRNIIYTSVCVGIGYLIFLCLNKCHESKPEPTKEKGWGYLHEEAN
jgi:hypothetical protein